jgi:exodeoxyribonuclease-3
MPRRSSRTLTAVAAGGKSKNSGDAVDDPSNANDDTATKSVTSSSSSLKGSDATPKKKKSVATKKIPSPKSNDLASDKPTPTTAATTTTSLPHENDIAPKKRKTKSLATASAAADDDEQSTNNTISANPTDEQPQHEAPKKKKAKAPTHQQWTERTPLTKHWDARVATQSTGSYTFTILSWNVAGLRALIKNHPDTICNLVQQYDVDVLCLQETKLQEIHMDDVKLKLKEYFEDKLGEYDGYFSYSIEKKGYSGTAMFIKRRSAAAAAAAAAAGTNGNKVEDGSKKKKQATLGSFFAPTKKGDESTSALGAEEGEVRSSSLGDVPVSHLRPIKVDTTLGLPAHDGEGRTITAEFPLFHLTNVYVPNSGQNLDRLNYRTSCWDVDFLAKMQQLEKDTKKPILWLGDLNVAYDEKDTWNEGAKHLAKSAGTTAEERASFARQLDAGYVDAFRHLHPEGRGHYTYWSQRAGNRAPNKGLRLDYFICSKELVEENVAVVDANGNTGKVRVRDCFMVPEIAGSDHCPIVLVSIVHCVLLYSLRS